MDRPVDIAYLDVNLTVAEVGNPSSLDLTESIVLALDFRKLNSVGLWVPKY